MILHGQYDFKRRPWEKEYSLDHTCTYNEQESPRQYPPISLLYDSSHDSSIESASGPSLQNQSVIENYNEKCDNLTWQQPTFLFCDLCDNDSQHSDDTVILRMLLSMVRLTGTIPYGMGTHMADIILYMTRLNISLDIITSTESKLILLPPHIPNTCFVYVHELNVEATFSDSSLSSQTTYCLFLLHINATTVAHAWGILSNQNGLFSRDYDNDSDDNNIIYDNNSRCNTKTYKGRLEYTFDYDSAHRPSLFACLLDNHGASASVFPTTANMHISGRICISQEPRLSQ